MPNSNKIIKSLISDLQMEEETHRKELADLKNKLIDAEANLSEQTKRRDDLEKQEQQYWKEYSKHKREVNRNSVKLKHQNYLR